MDFAQLSAIDDVEALRALVLEKAAELAARDAALAAREAQIESLGTVIAEWTSAVGQRDEIIRNRDITIEALTFEIKRLRRVQFSARSERMDPDQRSLFDEAIAADLAAVEAQLEALKAQQRAEMQKPA